jgi:hypothetical protein
LDCEDNKPVSIDPGYAVLSYLRKILGIKCPEEIEAEKIRQEYEDLKKDVEATETKLKALEKRVQEQKTKPGQERQTPRDKDARSGS